MIATYCVCGRRATSGSIYLYPYRRRWYVSRSLCVHSFLTTASPSPTVHSTNNCGLAITAVLCGAYDAHGPTRPIRLYAHTGQHEFHSRRRTCALALTSHLALTIRVPTARSQSHHRVPPRRLQLRPSIGRRPPRVGLRAGRAVRRERWSLNVVLRCREDPP